MDSRIARIAAFGLLIGGALLPFACSNGDGPPCDPTIDSLRSVVFAGTCTSCHSGADPAAQLDLSLADLEARVVDQPAATCDAILVVPQHPERSFLFEKVSSPAPACGAHMPVGRNLPGNHRACLEDWIAGLPPGCETCGTGTCIDLASDARHCGDCATACPADATCQAGVCVCAVGELCAGACTNTQTDTQNCGTCAHACVAQVCDAGQCSSSCTAPLLLCGASCVDTTNDAANCNGCGHACPAGEICQGSACVCPGGGDPATDPANCGQCGNACAPNSTCEAGVCTCAGGSVSFSAAVQPIFTSHCANQGCHVGAGAKQGLNLASGKAYANLVGVAASECTNRKRVQPSDPSASYLIDKLLGTNLCSGSRMPKLAALPAADIGTIATWICSGAANN